jgi:hypothetical protein
MLDKLLPHAHDSARGSAILDNSGAAMWEWLGECSNHTGLVGWTSHTMILRAYGRASGRGDFTEAAGTRHYAVSGRSRTG